MEPGTTSVRRMMLDVIPFTLFVLAAMVLAVFTSVRGQAAELDDGARTGCHAPTAGEEDPCKNREAQYDF